MSSRQSSLPSNLMLTYVFRSSLSFADVVAHPEYMYKFQWTVWAPLNMKCFALSMAEVSRYDDDNARGRVEFEPKIFHISPRTNTDDDESEIFVCFQRTTRGCCHHHESLVYKTYNFHFHEDTNRQRKRVPKIFSFFLAVSTRASSTDCERWDSLSWVRSEWNRKSLCQTCLSRSSSEGFQPRKKDIFLFWFLRAIFTDFSLSKNCPPSSLLLFHETMTSYFFANTRFPILE